MCLLTLSCREHSLEYSLFATPELTALAWGTVEGIGTGLPVRLQYDYGSPVACGATPQLDSLVEALAYVLQRLYSASEGSPLVSGRDIRAVGHRVVHGGERFRQSVAIDGLVLAEIARLERLAPKYNRPNRAGIEAALQLLPAACHVAIFDTAFHQTLPPYAYHYPLPHGWYRKHGVRRYGFHGPSHLYLSRRAALRLGRDVADCRLITVHMELGISLCAIAGGCSVDTSMGFTPVEGTMQERRSGTIDPGIPGFMMDWQELSAQQVEEVLNEKSGLLGVVGQGRGRRDVIERANAGEARAALAMRMECYGLRKYLGAYLAALGGCDAIVFSCGQGALEAPLRQQLLQGLEAFGVHLDGGRNACSEHLQEERCISPSQAAVQLWIIPTREEQVYAEDTLAVCAGSCREPWLQSYRFAREL